MPAAFFLASPLGAFGLARTDTITMALLSRKTVKIHLVFGTAALLLFLFIVRETRYRPPLRFEDVIEEARKKCSEPYAAATVPAFLSALSFDQYRQIRWRDEDLLWRDAALPFQIGFFHPGYLFNQPIRCFEVDRKGVQPIPYLPRFFDFGGGVPVQKLPANLGYAGFRIYYPLEKRDRLAEVASFLGASYFRMVGKNMAFGLSARGLAVDTVAKRREEFPAFTRFWLCEPAPRAHSLLFYALLDGPSVTGAYRFELEPGAETLLHVRAVLFLRRDREEIGLAPLTSMFWYGENTDIPAGNRHPEVHDSDGLLFGQGEDRWYWCPLESGKERRVSDFPAEDLRGFGLLQRDREFAHYDDLDMRYERRPSCWVEPGGSWPSGKLRLVELSTVDANLDNIVAYFVPEERPKPREPFALGYTLHWFLDHPQLPPMGRCLSTRVERLAGEPLRRFVLDFSGNRLRALAEDAPLRAIVESDPSAEIGEIHVLKNAVDQSWQVVFTAGRPGSSSPVRLRCRLELEQETLTETWIYPFFP
ncbi:glucan biosynthesis protein [Methylacidimicrobium sp. B4]|uniref:glucan biosynthesis protein n=1 Tax=Methylacidimicrobium sp. B4 TaxID=2796139 RepID=UPI001A8CB4C3|nr:glucan biosynthesis protein [Methylacidimicrobium sp. B4]QSR83986.1 glucan biosynthesis protein [Methylacidimicrobium sp. B4]